MTDEQITDAVTRATDKIDAMYGLSDRLTHAKAAIDGEFRPAIVAMRQENERLEKALEEEIENRDEFERQVSEIHKALGGDGEWVTRCPPQNPPDSGDCFLDSLALIDELMTQRTAQFVHKAMGLSIEQAARDASEADNAALRQQVADLERQAAERDELLSVFRAWKSELESSEGDGWMLAKAHDWMTEAQRLQRQVEKLRRDAERYQIARRCVTGSRSVVPVVNGLEDDFTLRLPFVFEHDGSIADRLDAAIDAAAREQD